MSLKFHQLLDEKFRYLKVAFYLFIVHFMPKSRTQKNLLPFHRKGRVFFLNLLINLNLFIEIDAAKISYLLSWFHIRQ